MGADPDAHRADRPDETVGARDAKSRAVAQDAQVSNGALVYLGGTEIFACNRCGGDHSVWEGVRVGWTAVGWHCLSDLERMSTQQRLSLIDRSWLPSMLQVGGPTTEVSDADDDKENDDEESE